MTDRDDFGLKLALLSNQWQGVVRRAQQRRGIIDSLVRQWQRYTELIGKLRHWLQEISLDPEDQQQGTTVALQQIRGMLDHIQVNIVYMLSRNIPLEGTYPWSKINLSIQWQVNVDSFLNILQYCYKKNE